MRQKKLQAPFGLHVDRTLPMGNSPDKMNLKCKQLYQLHWTGSLARIWMRTKNNLSLWIFHSCPLCSHVFRANIYTVRGSIVEWGAADTVKGQVIVPDTEMRALYKMCHSHHLIYLSYSCTKWPSQHRHPCNLTSSTHVLPIDVM